MRNLIVGLAVCSVLGWARAEDSENPDWHTIEVAKGEARTLTAEDVAALGAGTLVKTGGGTLVAGDEMANFAGDIRIHDGYYLVKTRGALGTADGKTYVNGGTLVNEAGADAKTDGSKPAFPSEEIHLQGAGATIYGALQNKVGGCVDFARTVVLDGDATIDTRGCRLDFRVTTFNMNGHTLTVEAGDGGFYFVLTSFQNMGDIDHRSGYLEFQGQTSGLLARTITVADNAQLGFWGIPNWMPATIVCGDNVLLRSENNAFKFAEQDNRAVLMSPIILGGTMRNEILKGQQVQMRGKVTGPGGIVGGQGGYLQLFNAANDFTGGLSLAGAVENGEPVGGLVLYANGAVPHGAGAAPLALTNGVLALRDVGRYDLPELVLDGRVVVSNMHTVTACHAAGLKKTGDGELTVFGPLAVEGDAEIAGTLRLVAEVPEVVSGLAWNYRNKQAGITSLVDQGVDATGVGYGYNAWPDGIDIEMNYTGYIRVPGEEGADVVCNWMTSFARGVKVTIGGVVCCEFNDNVNVKDNITVGWDRLAMYKPVTLKAGWQPITVALLNWWDTTRGPLGNTKYGWTDNFGIGVDWQSRSETNTAHYAKLLDPGDGSFLRPYLDRSEVDASKRRATFAGGVAFGAGAVFDVGDAAPYVPLTIPALTGLPTVRNGAVAVTSATWTIRRSDILDAADAPRGRPLTLEGAAALAFPAGAVTIDMPAEDAAALAELQRKCDCPLLADVAAFAANSFALSETLRDSGWYLATEGGRLILRRAAGLTLIIR
ncbi:MAG: hypothetical protein ACI4RA_05735 [Kiritimatiellia bacterium]